jgi:hypothetical protein
MEAEKPVILWLADNPDWAYASIVRQVGKCLTHYRHEVHYLMHGPQDGIRLTALLREADVVVPMYLLYHQVTTCKENMALMLTGVRPFEC